MCMAQHIRQDPMKILLGLLDLIIKPSTTSNTIIRYIQRHHINSDTYLPTLDGLTQMPLLYYCCSQPHLTELFNYLLNQNVNLHAPMISEQSNNCIELLYYSQVQYIPTLVKHGCKLTPENISTGVQKLLIKGNIVKLLILHQSGAITKEQLLPIVQTPRLSFIILDYLYERIYTLCQQYNADKVTPLINQVMKNYINVFKLLFKNGVNVNQTDQGEYFIQRVLNTYFIDLITLVIDPKYHPNFESIEFLHYSNFGLSNRQVMRIIYCEKNYQTINNLIKDRLIPTKINIKKPLTKKKIN